MISEFFGFDETLIFGLFEGKYLAVIPFALGVIILFYFYIFQRPKQKQEVQVITY